MTHLSYKTSMKLAKFLGKSAPEPIYDTYYVGDGLGKHRAMNNPQEDWIEYPAYTLEDILSRPFCEAFMQALKEKDVWMFGEDIGTKCFQKYWIGGMEAVEKEILRLMRGE